MKDRRDQPNDAAARLAHVIGKGQPPSPDDKHVFKKQVPTPTPRLERHGASPQSRPDPKPSPTPAPKPRTVSSGGTSPRPVCLNITKTQAQNHNSLLANTLSQQSLPISVRITKKFVTKGSPIALKNGQVLLLCFVVEVPTVLASYEGGRDQIRLPLYAMQRYERMPDGNYKECDQFVTDGHFK